MNISAIMYYLRNEFWSKWLLENGSSITLKGYLVKKPAYRALGIYISGFIRRFKLRFSRPKYIF